MFARSTSVREWRLVFGLAASLSIASPVASSFAAPPELPRSYVDTTYVAPTGATLAVAAGGNLQAALDAAQPGDVVTLQAGATFTGSFTLHAKAGTGWVIVRTSAPDSSLPPLGTRITPSYASVLPKIITSGSQPAVLTAPGAHHFRFIGVEFGAASGVTQNYGIVQLGDGSSAQSSLADVPHHFILDRVYIHGNATGNFRRGVSMHSAWTAVIDSTISNIHEVGADCQAIGTWNGPGPFKIVNNRLEASTENMIFGGADPWIANLVPSDIEVRGNYFFKPLSWRIGDPTYGGTPWQVKNLFELKNAQRVLVDGNIFENNWLHAQNGFAILFTVRNQDGTAPWSVVQDVTFTRNIVRHTASGVNILGQDNNFPSQQTKRILIKGNLFDDVDSARWGGDGRLYQILSGTAEVTIDHNTAFQSDEIIMADGPLNTGFVHTNNIAPNNQYGVAGTGTAGNPLLTLSTYFPGALFSRNVLMGGNAASYPINNFFPATWGAVGFVDFAGGNYHLSASSPYKAAGTDGADVGADIDALLAATAGVISGGGSPPPDTTPPVISGVAAAPVSSGANITWATNENSDTQVEYGTTTAYGSSTTLNPNLVTAHPQALGSLASATLHHYRVKSRDAAGNLAVSADFTFTTPDTTRPTVSLTAPLAGQTVSGTIAVSASASDNVGVVGVQFKLDGVNLGAEDLGAPFSVSWNTTTTANGSHSLTAVARDAAGNVTTSGAVAITVMNAVPDTTPPTTAITAPADGATVSNTVTVTASASDNVGVAGVQFFVDGVALGVEDTTAPYSISWNTASVANGSHTLRTVARDVAGNSTTSASVTVTVANVGNGQTPYWGQPFTIPGTIQAEDFDRGGEGVAYHDLVAGNAGGQYRTSEDVDIISPYAGGYVVNNIQTGEWLEYTINVTQAGVYRFEALVSTELAKSRWHMEVDGVNLTGPVTVPGTVRWNRFQWVGVGGVTLAAGTHVLRVHAEAQYFNLDALRIVP